MEKENVIGSVSQSDLLLLATVADYKRVFQSPTGKKVLEDLKRRCYFDKTTFEKGDTHHSAFKEGKRYVLLQILNMIDMDIEVLKKSMEQNNKKKGVADGGRFI